MAQTVRMSHVTRTTLPMTMYCCRIVISTCSSLTSVHRGLLDALAITVYIP